jgi:mannosyltransferase OCH1-like enzyme
MNEKIIHQIFIDIGKGSIDNVADGRFKQSKEMTIQYCNKHGYKYYFWTEEKINELLNKIANEYLNFYNNLRHPIQKIDFTKYIVLYYYGGIYFDLDINILPNKSIEHLFNINPLIVRWTNSNLPYNAILGCYKKSPVFLEIIKHCQIDYEEKSKLKIYNIWYGRFVFQTTGHFMLRRALKKCNINNYQDILHINSKGKEFVSPNPIFFDTNTSVWYK